MTHEETEKLLQRFMDGQTTREEEILLREQLSRTDCPAEWDVYRLMLQMPACEETALLPQDEADAEYNRIVRQRQKQWKVRRESRKTKQMHLRRTILIRAIGIAATVAIIWAWAANWEKPQEEESQTAMIGEESQIAMTGEESLIAMADEIQPRESMKGEVEEVVSASLPGLPEQGEKASRKRGIDTSRKGGTDTSGNGYVGASGDEEKESLGNEKPLFPENVTVTSLAETQNQIDRYGTGAASGNIMSSAVKAYAQTDIQSVDEAERKRSEEDTQTSRFIDQYIRMEELLGTKYYAGLCTPEETDSIVGFFRDEHNLQKAQLPFKGFHMQLAADFTFNAYAAGRQSHGLGRSLSMVSEDGQCQIYCQMSPRSRGNFEGIIDDFSQEIQFNMGYSIRTTRKVAKWTKDYLDVYSSNAWTRSSGADSVYIWQFPQPKHIVRSGLDAEYEGLDFNTLPNHDHAHGIAFCKQGRPVLRVWMFVTDKGNRRLKHYVQEICESINYI